jgi:hypothetical protein
MLWYQVLQNTIYCGKLQFTSYQSYENVHWGGFINCRQKIGGKRQKLKKRNQCSYFYLTVTNILAFNNMQQTTKREGG